MERVIPLIDQVMCKKCGSLHREIPFYSVSNLSDEFIFRCNCGEKIKARAPKPEEFIEKITSDLYRLSFVSKSKSSLGFKFFYSLIQKSQERNNSRFISGRLVFNEKFFFEVIEGNRKMISNLYHRIAMDERHQQIELLSFEKIDQRIFDDWSGNFFCNFKLFENLNHLDKNNFNPYEIEEKNLRSFIENLQRQSLRNCI